MKISKKIFKYTIFALIYGIFSFSLFSLAQEKEESVEDGSSEATEDLQKYEENLEDTVSFMNVILKIIYIFMWPLIYLAGVSMDNTLVYGSIFHLDVPLWKFWNMAKNFANFTLGFLVLFHILKGLFQFKKEGAVSKPLEIIKKALIAGVLIQASWFLVAAIIDISTIATYGVGGMPFTILKEDSKFQEKKMLKIHSEFNLADLKGTEKEDIEDVFKTWYSTQKTSNISPCKIQVINGERYIVGRKYGDKKYKHENIEVFGEGTEICVYRDKEEVVVLFKEFPGAREQTKNADYHKAIEIYLTYAQSNGEIDLNSYLGNFIKDETSLSEYIEDYTIENYIIKISREEDSTYNGIVEKGNDWKQDQGLISVGSVLDTIKGMTGPLVVLYSSMLNFTEIVDMGETDGLTGGILIEFLIKTIFALALIIPLLIIVFVLLARVVYLWLIIVASPLLVLKETFFKDKTEGFLGNFSIKNIMGIVFSPVITVFVLGISIVFMTALTDTLQDPEASKDFYGFLNNEKFKDDQDGGFNLLHGVEVAIEGGNINYKSALNGTKDGLAWMITNLIAIGLVWFLMFAAIKANKIGKYIVDKTGADKWAGQALQTIPIIRVGEGENRTGVGVGALTKGIGSFPSKYYENKRQKQYRKLQKNWEKAEITKNNHTTIIKKVAGGSTLSQAIKSTGKDISTSEYMANYADKHNEILDELAKSTDTDYSNAKLYNKNNLSSLNKEELGDALSDGRVIGADSEFTAKLSDDKEYNVKKGSNGKYTIEEKSNDSTDSSG